MSKAVVRKRRIKLTPYILLVPCFCIFGLFVYYPFVKTIYLSLHLTNASGDPVRFIGLGNYVRLFNNNQFVNSLYVTLRFAVLIGIPSFVIGFILALLANERLRGSRIYELMYSMPMAVASAPAAAIWFLIFSPGTGILNYLTRTDLRWLLDPDVALISIAIVTVWMNMGINFIFLLTGLRNIPDELIESSRIDGAGYFTRLLRVMIPIASPQIFFVIFLNIVLSFQSFTQVKLLTQGGPIYSTDILIHSIYRSAFIDGRFETASAQSIILFLIICVVTIIQMMTEKKGVHYSA